MPAILDKVDEKAWIDISLPSEDAHTLLKPCPSEFLKAHTISSLINEKTANRNNSEVIRPYVYGMDNRLF